MSYLDCYSQFWKGYVKFDGRATRTMFIVPAIANMIVSLLLTIIFLPLGIVWAIATFLPSIALLIRRLHDCGKSALWILWILLPVVGGLFLLVYCLFVAGNPYANEYGEDPHANQAAA